MRRVFLTGASGLIGGALLERLRQRGDQVVALARSDQAARTLAARGVEVVRGQAWEEDALAAGMAGCELGFHVAGVNSLCPRDTRLMCRTNIDGALAAVRAAHRARMPRLLLTSSAATIGEAPGTLANEWSAHRGWYLSEYERSKTEGERVALAEARRLGQDLVCVNPSSVQGPGRVGGTGRFLLAALDGRLRAVVRTSFSMVDIEDCVHGHLAAAERGAAGERYLLSGICVSSEELVALIEQASGRRCRPLVVGRSVALLAAGALEAVFKLSGRRAPLCREMVRTMLHGHRYDGSRAERELGISYTSAQEMIRRTLVWAREEGLLRSSRPTTAGAGP
jgi:dihydroflavonol-4-reductase